MYNKYPYTDFSELNLDWFLGQFKELMENWDAQKVDYNQFKLDVTTEFNTLSGKFDNLKDAFDDLYDYVHDYFDDLDVQQEINNKLDEMVANGTMTLLIKPIFDDYALNMTDRMDTLEARMNTFASLPDGSTAGEAELEDIRIGANGITYPSAGEAVRGQVTDLQDEITKIKNVTVTETPGSLVVRNIFPDLTWTDGYMTLGGGTQPSTTLRYSSRISVRPGDLIAFQNTNFDFSYVTAFNGATAVVASGATQVNSYTVPDGIDGVIVTEYISRGTAAINHTYHEMNYENVYKEDIEALDEVRKEIIVEPYTETSISNIYDSITWTPGYMNKGGTTDSSATTLHYSQKISVTAGDNIRFGNTNFSFRFVTAFSGLTAVSASGDENVNSYTVPEGIDGIVVSAYVSNVGAIYLTVNTIELSHYVKRNMMGKLTEYAQYLENNDEIKLPEMQVKNHNRYIFNGRIDLYSKVQMGKQPDTYIEVDTDYLIIHNDATVTSVRHNLNIQSDICIMICNEESINASLIRISSRGDVFEYTTPIRFLMDTGAAYVKSIGSKLENCRLSWTSENVNKPIWIFGDSYLSWYPERWTYYAAEDNNLATSLLNGYAGQNSQSAYFALINLLDIHVPDKLVWCLGMNDPDSGAVNAVWYDIYLKLIELQKKYGFELVLYTVPTTPTMDNSYKDAIIRSSGYRYIDVDTAVRIDNVNWIPGTLDVDNVHPTAAGAKVIYNCILTDLPEIMAK